MNAPIFTTTAYIAYPLSVAAAGLLAKSTAAAAWVMFALLCAVVIPAYLGAHARRKGGRLWPWAGKIFLLPLLVTTALAAPQLDAGLSGGGDALRLSGVSDLWAFGILGVGLLCFAWAWHLSGLARLETR